MHRYGPDAKFRGHHRYSDGCPDLRWASQGAINSARLSIGANEIELVPLRVFRRMFRMPTVRIPVAAIESVWAINWGVKFNTPSRPDLDGTVFKANTARGGRELRATIEGLGIRVEEMSARTRLTGWFGDFSTRQANGRDRRPRREPVLTASPWAARVHE
jgi:hypothetical protein